MSNSKKRPAEGEAPAKKKRRKAKPKFEDDGLIDLELGVNQAIARMDSQLMADHLAQKTSLFGADLSSVELSDLSIPGKKTRNPGSALGRRPTRHYGSAATYSKTVSAKRGYRLLTLR